MKKWVDIDFDVGQKVYLITDEDQKARIVCEIVLRQTGVLYKLSQGTIDSFHYSFEISADIDVKIKTSDK